MPRTPKNATAGITRPKTAPKSLFQEAYAEIKRRILSNEYPGGYQVLEDQLCEELGMSRTPLREALTQLRTEGMLETLPRRGMRVLPLTARDIADIYEVLSALELLAVRSLAEMKDNAKQVNRLQVEVDTMQRALAEDDLDAWAMADERFHRVLVDESGNPRLASAARTLLDQSQRFRMFTLRLRDKPTASTNNHGALVSHLRAHDVENALAVHSGHKRQWHERMHALMKKFGIRNI